MKGKRWHYDSCKTGTSVFDTAVCNRDDGLVGAPRRPCRWQGGEVAQRSAL